MLFFNRVQLDSHLRPEVAEAESHVIGWCEGGKFVVVKDLIFSMVFDGWREGLRFCRAVLLAESGKCGIRGRVVTINMGTDADKVDRRR